MSIVLTVASLTAVALESPAAAGTCVAQRNCGHLTAAKMFAAAEELARQGNVAGAAQLLEALTQDPHLSLRAEARFRLAGVREKLGDLSGAVEALRDLLAEQPNANPARLELARLLARLGNRKAAKAEIAVAQAVGLPPGVDQTVRRFASTLTTTKKRGLTLELTQGPDSNVNRSTSSLFVDTIIAPFQLDADARRQAALGFSGSLRGYSRDRIAGISFLSNAGLRADLSTKPRFNDVQLTLDSGPQASVGGTLVQPAFLYERRWFGGDPYSVGVGGQVELVTPLARDAQFSFSGSRVHQKIAKNSGQDGWRTAITAEVTRDLGAATTARLSLRFAKLEAKIDSESLRQYGASFLLAHHWRPLTLFGEADLTLTRGSKPLFLFGKIRHDSRVDVVLGAIINSASIGGFTPLVRIIHSDSSANIVLYDYRRTRFDFGVTRSF